VAIKSSGPLHEIQKTTAKQENSACAHPEHAIEKCTRKLVVGTIRDHNRLGKSVRNPNKAKIIKDI